MIQEIMNLLQNLVLILIPVLEGGDVSKEAFTDVATGILINSGFLNGFRIKEAKK